MGLDMFILYEAGSWRDGAGRVPSSQRGPATGWSLLGCLLLKVYEGKNRCNEEKERTHMQGSKLYVGNLTYSVTEEQLKKLFSAYGDVKEVRVIERKGFGFVEMATPEDAEKAKAALNETNFEGRTLKIDEARPPQPRSSFRPRY
jgi:RNA recognition motif-containing protein